MSISFLLEIEALNDRPDKIEVNPVEAMIIFMVNPVFVDTGLGDNT